MDKHKHGLRIEFSHRPSDSSLEKERRYGKSKTRKIVGAVALVGTVWFGLHIMNENKESPEPIIKNTYEAVYDEEGEGGISVLKDAFEKHKIDYSDLPITYMGQELHSVAGVNPQIGTKVIVLEMDDGSFRFELPDNS